MMQPEELREHCAVRLLTRSAEINQLSAFVGLDGFVDEIVHAVDKREDALHFQRLPTISALSERISAAAGKSTNIELVNQRTKLGGNGPIMANALARLGVKVTYVGALGYPNLHPVFNEFAQQAEIHSIAEAGHTDALEFEDGKIMLTKSVQLNEISWQTIQSRFGRDRFLEVYSTADLIAFVNWTMIPGMSDLWAALLEETGPSPRPVRQKIFFDLADPEKRTAKDILRALQLIGRFEKHFDVILGLNEKEAYEISEVLNVSSKNRSRDGLCLLATEIQRLLGLSVVVVHPVSFALAVSSGTVSTVEGPYVEKPLITTGAGDHFNAGFCLAKCLGLDNAASVLVGVTASGYYVRNARSPNPDDLAHMLRNWPLVTNDFTRG
jgi:sugar/nucleoside kinase (ribokinase family)